MIFSYELWIAYRYFRSRREDGFISIVSWFSLIGISLGVATLIIVMSVMNGFRSELIDKIVGFNAHAVVNPNSNKLDPDIYKNYIIKKNIKNVVVSNNAEGVFVNKNQTKGLLLKGYLKKDFKNLDIIKNNNFKGSNNLFDNFISIGKELSFNFDIGIGDKIAIMSPSGVQTIVGTLPKQEIFEIISIFDIKKGQRIYEIDL